uniref:J_Vc14.3 prepropeptide n=1 Tax=Conus victoriae TaxID=319920 RepID=W4VSB3_CONVC
MTSVQSVTCCCFLWLMLSVQLISPSSPGTAHLPRDGTDRAFQDIFMVALCPVFCFSNVALESCNCEEILDLVSSLISRKRSMAM